MLTILFQLFHSEHLVEELIKNIPSEIPTIFIESSKNFKLKHDIESKYKNIRVIIPDTNEGFSAGMNLGIKNSNTNFVFLNPPDEIITKECINKLLDCIKKFKDFALLAPTYEDESIYQNYRIFSKKNNVEDETLKKYGGKEVDFVDGTFIINKSKLEKIGYFDENFFLYFEVLDLSRRITQAGEKMFVCDKIKFVHLGGKSHNPKYNLHAKLNRNWHYNWSKFYFYKKHHGYFYGLRKTLKTFIKSFFKMLFCILKNDKKEFELYKAEFTGLTNAYLLKKSSFRPYEIKSFKF